jgi:hypothetical protein
MAKKDNSQCTSCPFRVDSSVEDIPGYDLQKHEDLRKITVEAGHEPDYTQLNKQAKIMACHNRELKPCIGWVNHQIKADNIGLKVNIALGALGDIFPLKLKGRQVKTFDDTFNK